jgi:nucleotide-binding universal stress UspA family protein
MAGMIRDLRSVLIHVQHCDPKFIEDAAHQDALALEDLDRLQATRSYASEALLERYQGMLQDGGILVERVVTVSCPQKEGVAKIILNCGHEIRSRAIVVGRRGLTALKKKFLGSVSTDLVAQTTVMPIWVVGREPTNDRILVPVDGSESALRAVEHLCQMFTGNTDMKFQFYHVIPRMIESCPIYGGPGQDRLERAGRRGSRHCIDDFYARASSLFTAAGLDEKQMDIKIAESMLNPGKGIVAELNRGDYRTVIIGRRGRHRSFLAGSVSRYLMDRTDQITIWLVT